MSLANLRNYVYGWVKDGVPATTYFNEKGDRVNITHASYNINPMPTEGNEPCVEEPRYVGLVSVRAPR